MELKTNPNVTVTEPNAEPAAMVQLSEDRKREIRAMSAEQIETRRAEIKDASPHADAATLDAFEAELSELETRSKELNAIETRRQQMQEIIRGGGTVIAKAPAVVEQRTRVDILNSDAYVDAYAKGVKTGDYRECRALLTDLVDGGTVPVPTYISDRVATDWEKLSILPRIRRTQIPGVVKFPFEYSATDAATHTEGAAAPSEETLQLGSVSVSPEMVKKWISYSHEVAALTGRTYLDYLYNELEYRILRAAEDTAIGKLLSASATLTTSACNVPALTVPAIDAGTIFAAQALLSDEALNPVAIMNKQTYFTGFMALTDTTGRPIYNVVSENGKPSYYVNGIPVLFSNQLTSGTEILVGDLDGLVCTLPEGYGVHFITDPYSLAEKDLVKVVGRMYAGFGLVRPRFFAKVTVSGGTSGGDNSGTSGGGT
ncbi:MAG: phage major capsid protein [Oscillospiraceae bacterium]|nr:phage major capsid protein [Oscillospiraceae bacterium]